MLSHGAWRAGPFTLNPRHGLDRFLAAPLSSLEIATRKLAGALFPAGRQTALRRMARMLSHGAWRAGRFKLNPRHGLRVRFGVRVLPTYAVKTVDFW
jgi:hypothetical protein